MTPVGEIMIALLEGARSSKTLPELLCLDAKTRLGALGTAVMLADDAGALHPLAASDEHAVAVQMLQFDLGEGACLDVLDTGRMLLIDDVAAQGARWPAYSPALLDLGVRGLASFPLRVGGIRLGVLDVYRDATGRADETSLALALDFADAAVLILLHLQEFSNPDEETTGWLDAGFSQSLRTHPEVHQATGMVSVQAGVGLAEALLLLRAHAYTAGRSLVEVASDVVDRLLRFDGTVGPDGPEG